MKTKFNLDREPLESDYINSKKDFDKVVKGYKVSNYPVWKRPWFYGPTGAAAFALILSMTIFNEDEQFDKTDTLATTVQNINDLEDTPCVQPLSETKDLAFGVYTVQAGEDQVLELPSGNKITFSANSLLADGAVEIKVREFNSIEEAMLAGIPMDYKKDAFESAGMMEIRAFQNGKEVLISEENPISVSMNVRSTDEAFKFWYLDENNKNWISHEADITEFNPENLEEELKSTDIRITLIDTECKPIQSEITELNKPIKEEKYLPKEGAKTLVIDFDAKDFPELAAFKDVHFEYLNYTDQLSKTLKSQTWTKMELKKADGFYAEFSNRRNKAQVKVKPVLSGDELVAMIEKVNIAKAEKAERKKVLEEKEKQLLAQRGVLEKRQEALKNRLMERLAATNSTNASESNSSARMAAMAAVSEGTAEFRTTQFGIFNSDKPVKYPALLAVPVILLDKLGRKLNPSRAFVIDHKKNVRYSYSMVGEHSLDDIAWNDNRSSIVVIDMDGNMYYQNNIDALPIENGHLTLENLKAEDLEPERLKEILGEKNTLV